MCLKLSPVQESAILFWLANRDTPNYQWDWDIYAISNSYPNSWNIFTMVKNLGSFSFLNKLYKWVLDIPIFFAKPEIEFLDLMAISNAR